MFRLLQGDVELAKQLLHYVLRLMLSNLGIKLLSWHLQKFCKQHYNLAKKIFSEKINLAILSKSEYKKKNYKKK